jgi:hypothetical protein
MHRDCVCVVDHEDVVFEDARVFRKAGNDMFDRLRSRNDVMEKSQSAQEDCAVGAIKGDQQVMTFRRNGGAGDLAEGYYSLIDYAKQLVADNFKSKRIDSAIIHLGRSPQTKTWRFLSGSHHARCPGLTTTVVIGVQTTAGPWTSFPGSSFSKS